MTKTATVHAQQMWEYRELTRKSAQYLAQELNEIGQQGWELVAVQQGTDRKNEAAWIAFVKRPYVPGSSPAPAHTAAPDRATSSPGKAHPAPPQATDEAAFPIGDDQEFKLEDLEDLVKETSAPAAKAASPAAESDDSKDSPK